MGTYHHLIILVSSLVSDKISLRSADGLLHDSVWTVLTVSVPKLGRAADAMPAVLTPVGVGSSEEELPPGRLWP